jgi:hypothetical protein
MVFKITCLKCERVSHMTPRGEKPEFSDLKCMDFAMTAEFISQTKLDRANVEIARLTAKLTTAVADERERCAKIADGMESVQNIGDRIRTGDVEPIEPGRH